MTGFDVRVGGYTPSMGSTAEGISLLRWQVDGARLESVGTTPTSSPTSLAAGAGWLVYVTVEAGRIAAFRGAPGTLLEANQLSSNVSVVRLDTVTGIPHPLGSPVDVASPTFLLPVL